MVVQTYPEVEWDSFPESDGEPMAETQANAIQMVELGFALSYVFEVQGRADRTAVAGNQLMYVNPANGRDHIAPDVYVILDYAPPVPPSWKTWVEGKFPEIVFEITSPSTQAIDVSEEEGRGKRWRYGQLGVREYYIFDPQGVLEPVLQGYVRGEGGTRLVPLAAEASGGLVSPLMGAELRVIEGWLRVIDLRTGSVIATPDQERALRIAEQQDRLALEGQLAVEQRARLAEQQARAAAEERAARRTCLA